MKYYSTQYHDLNPTEHAFHLLKARLRAETPTNNQQSNYYKYRPLKASQRKEAHCSGVHMC